MKEGQIERDSLIKNMEQKLEHSHESHKEIGEECDQYQGEIDMLRQTKDLLAKEFG